MSTTGNEYEQPGVNYPDREDAQGATDTPGDGDATRDGQPGMEGQEGQDGRSREVEDPEAAAAVPGAGAAEEGHGGAFPPPQNEPSHEAVGIGVIDDGRSEDPQAMGGHQGQDGGRETMTASQAQREGALGTEQEQRLPAMSQNNATEIDKISGIVAQTRQDVGSEQVERVEDVLRQRLEQSGIDLPDSDIQELARQITTGDARHP